MPEVQAFFVRFDMGKGGLLQSTFYRPIITIPLPPKDTRDGPAGIPKGGPSTTVLVMFCGGLMMLSGFSTDVMLPAFTTMAKGLDAPLAKVQDTLTYFAFCFGVSQIFYGPASDRYGRRPAIAVGMSIFLIGSSVATFGGNIDMVLLGRALQGVGAGAAPVLARAILRDTHSGTALARVMATSFAIFAIGPIIAPLTGYAIMAVTGWRGIFAATGAVGLGLLMFNLFRYRETNAELDAGALRLGNLARAFLRVSANRQSIYFMICGMAAYCALFTFLANSPRIYKSTFGLDGLGFAAMFAICGFGIILGQMANRALLPRLGILSVLKIASLILLCASSMIGILNLLGMINAWAFTVLMFCFNTSFLVVVSNTAALCLNPHPRIAGMASAFYGFATNCTAAVFTSMTVFYVGNSLGHWSSFMVGLTALCAVLIWRVNAKNLDFN